MKIKLLSALISVFFLWCCSAAIKPTVKAENLLYASEEIEKQYNAGAKVSVMCTNENNSDPFLVSGSSVAVGPSTVLTAKHVTDCDGGKAFLIMLELRDGRVAPAEIAEEAIGHNDVVSLTVKSTTVRFSTWADISMAKPKIGEMICIVSQNPLPHWTRTCGTVSDYRDGNTWGGEGSFAYKGLYLPGTSGSGIYNSSGKLVGIHVGSNRIAQYGVGYFTSTFLSLLPNRFGSLP